MMINRSDTVTHARFLWIWGCRLLLISFLAFLIHLHQLAGAWYDNMGAIALTSALTRPALDICLNDSVAAPQRVVRPDKLEAARQSFLAALRYWPEDTSARIGWGLVECIAGDAQATQQVWGTLSATVSRSRFYLGLSYFMGGQVDRAAETFAMDASNAKFLRAQTLKRLNDGNLEKALGWAQLATRAYATQENAQTLADLYVRLGRRPEALGVWQMLAEHTTDESADHWFAVAERAKLQGDLQTARDAYLRGAAVAREPYVFYERLGIAQRDAGDWTGALESFRMAIRARPVYSFGYLYAGDAVAHLGRESEAMDYYRQAQQLAPTSELADIRMALLAMQRNQYDVSILHLGDALAKNPKDSVAHYYLAQCYDALQQRSRAIEQLEVAVQLAPQSAWWSLLGKWYEESGMTTQAAEARTRAASSQSYATPAADDGD